MNTRSNTPESSAAQGAMGDVEIDIKEAEQDWANIDGAVAFHLIDRHADSWSETGDMMEAWAKARFAQPSDATAQPSADASTSEAKGNISAWLRRRAHNDLVMMSGSLAAQIADHIDALANTAQGKTEHIADVGKMVQPTYTTGHCEHHKQPGGCQQHNLHCGWPKCDQRALAAKKG